MAADLLVANLIALCEGRNEEADATGLLAVPDEELATELQLQEVILVSSAMAAIAARSSLMPQLDTAVHTASNFAATAETPALAVIECCPSSSSSSSSPPPLAAPATGEDETAAATTAHHVAVAEFCKICLDHVSPSDVHRASSGCTHAFCAGCLAHYISVKIKEGRSGVIKCPGEDCGSVLDPELCQGILSKEAFEDWCAALCMSMVLGGSSNVCYCPFNDCSEIMVDDRGGENPESECLVCRRLFCAQCTVPWHAGVSCDQYMQLAPEDRRKEDLQVLEMANGNKWKRCPRCKFFVERHDGCAHMTCRCGFQFCYACGEPWDGHSSCNTA
ncbi:unnamed protein product [Urochloa decumbens]|uniref:RBR-type E3 ubiquitin transferase n=1 Tax=Urochloa decumbens TaxID=240449 RepID=A0ABC9BWW8_9POAL